MGNNYMSSKIDRVFGNSLWMFKYGNIQIEVENLMFQIIYFWL